MPYFFDIATYDFVKVANILDVPATYTTLAQLTTPEREEGLYEIGFSLTVNFDQATKSVFMQYSLDGGSSWTELISEPPDATDTKPFTYVFPKERPQGVFDMIFQMRKEDLVGTLNVKFLDLWYKRVGDLT